SKGGFTLGVITSLNINENFKIRFVLPSLSFQESEMEYTYLNPSNLQQTVYVKSLRPVYLDFPVLLKFRTNRINNFAVYGIAGLRYGIDMSSNIDVNNSIDLEDQVIKLNKHDFGSEIGGGIDLFLQYFKLGIELKLGSGMRNMLYDTPGEDPTKFDNAIESLRSRVWTLSFTFEG
ncbi:MAG: porin family protein, partial [Flavobacteriales bacterium]